MLKAKYKKIGTNFDDKIGGITNETRYAEKEILRNFKRLTLPALNCGGFITFFQAWNNASKKKDVIRLKIEQDGREIEMVFRRIDLEQIIFAMAQGDEVIKYIRTEAEVQRKWAEPLKKE